MFRPFPFLVWNAKECERLLFVIWISIFVLHTNSMNAWIWSQCYASVMNVGITAHMHHKRSQITHDAMNNDDDDNSEIIATHWWQNWHTKFIIIVFANRKKEKLKRPCVYVWPVIRVTETLVSVRWKTLECINGLCMCGLSKENQWRRKEK